MENKKLTEQEKTLLQKISDLYEIPQVGVFNIRRNGKLMARNVDNEINNFGAVIFHRIVQKLAENTEKKEENPAEKIKKYIDGNIYDKINAKSVARASGFSVSQIGRLFKNEYGTTVYSYILEQKIKAAEKLLKNSSLSIKETASILNFTDEHYFCNIFKRKRGMTPGEFRKSSGLLLAEY